MPTDPVLTALRTLGNDVLRARDGRGEWRPTMRALDALHQAGVPDALAQRCAQAMVAVARPLRTAALPRVE